MSNELLNCKIHIRLIIDYPPVSNGIRGVTVVIALKTYSETCLLRRAPNNMLAALTKCWKIQFE